MSFPRGHRRNDNSPMRSHIFSRTGHSALQCRKFQITRREKKPIGCQRDGEYGGNGGGGENGRGGGNGGGGGRNRGGGGSKNRSASGGKQKKISKDFESGDKTARPDCYFCLGPHKPSECLNRSASATVPPTSNSQHGVFWGSVRTNLGAGLLVATSARPACAGHEDEYRVANSGATENRTHDSSNLEDYTPVPPGGEVESAGGVFLPVAGYGCLRLLMDQDNGTFKRATRELTLDRAAHVPKLGLRNLL